MCENEIEKLAKKYKRNDPDGLEHLAAVSSLLRKWGCDDPVTQGIAWGHDLLEDTSVSEKKILTVGGVHGDEIRAGIKALTFLTHRQRLSNRKEDGSFKMSDAEFDRRKREFLKGIWEKGGVALKVKLADRLCTVESLVGRGEDDENFGRAVRYLRQSADMFKGLESRFGRDFAAKVEDSKKRVRALAGDRPFIETMSRREFTDMMLQNGADHSDGYYQYTQWENLRQMMKGAELADGVRHRVILLTNMKDTNDGIERFWSRRDYIACFSYSKYEDVAMWLNYGKKRGYSSTAVRIHFDRDAMKDWYAAIGGGGGRSLQKRTVFGVKLDDEKGILQSTDVSDLVEGVYLADVGYIVHRKYLTDHHSGNIEYRRKFYRVLDENKTQWADEVYEAKKSQTELPIFKKRGWAYEREVRLIVRMKEEVCGKYDRIAICFDGPFEKLVNDLATWNDRRTKERIWRFPVMSGPWYDGKPVEPLETAIGKFGLGAANRSDYSEEIKVL